MITRVAVLTTACLLAATLIGCGPGDPSVAFQGTVDAINDQDLDALMALAYPEAEFEANPLYRFQGWTVSLAEDGETVLNPNGNIATFPAVATHRANSEYKFDFEIGVTSENGTWQVMLNPTIGAFEASKEEWKAEMANQPGPRDGLPSNPYKLGETVDDKLDFEDNIFAHISEREAGLVGPTGEEAFYDLYTFEAEAGQEVTFVLRSNDLDVFLAIAGKDVTYMVAPHIAQQYDPVVEAGEGWFNDDINYEGNVVDSAVHVVFPTAGTYHIYCTQYERGSFGTYKLTSHAGPPAADERIAEGSN